MRRFSILSRQLLLAVLAFAVAGTGLVVVAGPAQADGGHNGTVDVLESPQAGLFHVKGWVYDLDDGSAPVRLHLYVGGTFSDPGAQFVDLGVTDVSRSDVPGVHPAAGPTTGFDRTVEVSKYGSQPVFLYALNAAGSVGDPGVLLNGNTVTISNPNPGGEFLSATSPAPGQVSVSGFALDQSPAVQRTRVVVTAAGAYAGTLVADQRGPGFEDFPVMFNGVLPSAGGDVSVCVTAMNQGVGSDQSLGCRQVTVEPLPPPPPVVTPPPAEPQGVTLRLKAVKKKSRLRIDVGPDLNPSNYRFTVQRKAGKKAGKKWRTVRRSQTLGPRDRGTINLRRGKYRVVVPRQHGLAGARATVRLKR